MRAGGLARGSLIIGILAVAALGLLLQAGSKASAGVPENTVVVGDIWFCNDSFQGGVCDTEIDAGDTVIWDFSTAGLPHTTTECGASCDDPTDTPLWDSGVLNSGSKDPFFERTFDDPGIYLYFCEVHPSIQRGRIIVAGEPALVGDANCDDRVNAIDAAIVLQHDGGLLQTIPCADNADANQNGTVNAIDAALILQYDAGLLGQLPP